MTAFAQVGGPTGWRGSGLRDSERWSLLLGGVHRSELIAAVGAVEASGTAVGDISREEFPLPTLAPLLSGVAGELMDGRGFSLVRGVPVTGLSGRQREIVAVGIGCHVGSVVGQGPDKAPVLHVRSEGADPAEPTSRGYQHSRRLDYHTDPTDVVALLCVRPAKSGGLGSIVSSTAVHDEIVRTRPDVAAVLHQPWWFDRRRGNGPDSFFSRPVYSVGDDGRLSAYYGLDYMRSAQRGAHVPPLSPAQTDAMEALDQLNNDPRFVLTMDLRAGDMQFLNNHVVMHSRSAYEDHPEPHRRRDLIRLRLADDRHPAGPSMPWGADRC
jgi:hypothetical protein